MIALILLVFGALSFAYGVYRAASHGDDEDAGNAGPWMLGGIALAFTAGLVKIFATGALAGS